MNVRIRRTIFRAGRTSGVASRLRRFLSVLDARVDARTVWVKCVNVRIRRTSRVDTRTVWVKCVNVRIRHTSFRAGRTLGFAARLRRIASFLDARLDARTA